MIEFLEETGRNAQNSEAPIESKPIAHTKFYGQFVGLIQEISKNCNQLSECFELSGGYVQINGVNYPISLRNKEQIEKLVSALYVIKNNAIPMNVEKKKQFGRSYSSYYYNTDEQIIDAEAEAKREETNMVRLAGR